MTVVVGVNAATPVAICLFPIYNGVEPEPCDELQIWLFVPLPPICIPDLNICKPIHVLAFVIVPGNDMEATPVLVIAVSEGVEPPGPKLMVESWIETVEYKSEKAE